MTIHDDPAARDALRVQLFQAIDGVPPDPAEGVVGSFPGLLERCDQYAAQLAAVTEIAEREASSSLSVAVPTLITTVRSVIETVVVGGRLIQDFGRFAAKVRELLTRETEQLDKLPRSNAETVVDVSSTRAGVRLNVAGALLRGGLDQSGTCDAQAAIRFALDVLSAAFDHQAGRFDDEVHDDDVLSVPEDAPSRLLRVFAPGTRVTAALDIFYADRDVEIASGTTGTVVSTALSRDVSALSAVHWDDHEGIYPTSNDSIDPVRS